MYAKLFSRITESSIIEESITTRWVFVGMLAIADVDGTVIGTDIAIARRLNVPLKDFEESMKVLMAADKESNNEDFQGKRIIPSLGERGYFLTGYQRYRSLKTEDERREYMRVYMSNKRLKTKELQENVNSVNFPLAQLTHAEEEANAKKSVVSKKRPVLTDEEFTMALQNNPAYKAIDINNEMARMDAWLLSRPGRRKTRKFVTAWLNRIEAPMAINSIKRPDIF